MATMIPDRVPKHPPSEKTVFKILKKAKKTSDWVIFHSFKVSKSPKTKNPRDIDFLILIPKYFSIICLEAKGGSYYIRHGQWYLDKSTTPEDESPPEQAENAMWALKKKYEKYFQDSSLLSIGCAVVFTHGNVVGKLPACLPEIIGRSVAYNPKALVKRLMDYADKMRRWKVRSELKQKKNREEAQKAWDNIERDLNSTATITNRPEMVHRVELDTLSTELVDLTDDQIEGLEKILLDENKHIVINGAAGTGKTVLAMELATRHCEDGESVALLCSNPFLSSRFVQWARRLSISRDGKIVAGTPATLPFRVFEGTYYNKHDDRLKKWPELEGSLKLGYLSDGLIPFINETVEDLKHVEPDGIFDYLIVDEAQNLCTEEFLKLMDALLKGGLAEGRWSMFGDFDNQEIVSSHKTKMKALDDRGLHWTTVKLTTNCRNTHEIAESVAKVANVISHPISGVSGPMVQFEYFTSTEDLENQLDSLVDSLIEREFLSEQIILLTSGVEDEFDVKSRYGGWKLRNISISETKGARMSEDKESILSVSDASTPLSTLRYSNVYDFQGLESELAILVLPVTENQDVIKNTVTLPDEKHLRRVLYTGMSRAKKMLIIVAHESYKITLERRLELGPTLKNPV